jgi:hypothetical protein
MGKRKERGKEGTGMRERDGGVRSTVGKKFRSSAMASMLRSTSTFHCLPAVLTSSFLSVCMCYEEQISRKSATLHRSVIYVQ